MEYNFTIEPNSVTTDGRVEIESEEYGKFTGGFVGAYTYCWDTCVENGMEFDAPNGVLCQNLQVGRYNSIGSRLLCVFGRNHNIKSVSTGAVALLEEYRNVRGSENSAFCQKGSIVIQNDVWIGSNVTVMPGVTVRNGAVIARNSHVVSDVPPYAAAGGNPARVIGYRYTPEQIEMLQLFHPCCEKLCGHFLRGRRQAAGFVCEGGLSR